MSRQHRYLDAMNRIFAKRDALGNQVPKAPVVYCVADRRERLAGTA